MWSLVFALALAGPSAQAAAAADPFDAVPFDATATISPDGRWTLVLIPGESWSAAELTVRGAGSFDLGAQDGTRPIEVSGLLDGAGTLYVDLSLVTGASRGVSWSFPVEPELLPTAPPESARSADRRRGFWPFRGKASP